MTTSPQSLDVAFIEAQKQKLGEEQTRLEAELSRIANKGRAPGDYEARVEEIGRMADDNAIEEEQYEAARSVEQSLEVQLRGVKAALVRIAEGTYGICATCGAPIEQKRLEALPSASTCLAHAG